MFNLADQQRKPLLSTNNAKTIKGNGKGYLTYILYMSPFTANSEGKNLCPYASAGCAASCLVGSGMGGIYDTVKQGRINKTEYFLKHRGEFFAQLKAEIEKALAKNARKPESEQANLVFRLNGTSDLSYEQYKVFGGKNIFEVFPDVQFYDYTKNYNRFKRALPANYYLTFSRSETNHVKAIELLAKGVNVAMVFDKLPAEYEGYKVIDADKDDLRFLDPREAKGVICGLKYKFMTGAGGGLKNIEAFTSGFAIRTQTVKQRIAKVERAINKTVAKATKKPVKKVAKSLAVMV